MFKREVLARSMKNFQRSPVDAAMAFLVAGGITSAWAAVPVASLLRFPVFRLSLVLAIVCSMLAGWG